MADWKSEKELVNPVNYGYCHMVARQALGQGAEYIWVPSARKVGGECIPVFKSGAARLNAVLRTFDLYWDGTRAYIDDGVSRRYVVVDRVYEMI
jgi:hypothetical protein